MCNLIDELISIFNEKKNEIENRLKEFENNWISMTEEELFKELVFCILTPQSKARMAEKVVNYLNENKLLFNSTPDEISRYLNLVRFKNKKAYYICEARKIFMKGDKISIRDKLNQYPEIFEKRKWLYKNINGIGIKEASHFLRNIGLGKNIAILDRHVLRNLYNLGLIEENIKLNEKKYLEIEGILRDFSKKINIQMEYLDFVFLYKNIKDIFK